MGKEKPPHRVTALISLPTDFPAQEAFLMVFAAMCEKPFPHLFSVIYRRSTLYQRLQNRFLYKILVGKEKSLSYCSM
jgi:hypothetical protein